VAKFKASFEGYPEDLVRVVGMAMNAFVRKVAEEQGAKAARSTFLRPSTATPEWLAANITEQIAISLFQRPIEKRSVQELCRRVWEEYRPDIEEWIESNKANLAEIGFLFPDGDVDTFEIDMAAQAPPVKNFAVPAKPAPPQGMSAIICRRGRK
jgi:hypothetical protein